MQVSECSSITEYSPANAHAQYPCKDRQLAEGPGDSGKVTQKQGDPISKVSECGQGKGASGRHYVSTRERARFPLGQG